MKLYVDPITVHCRKVLAGFELLEVDYDLVVVDSLTTVLPVFVDEELVLWEPNAILQYAADKTRNRYYYPTDRGTRAEIHRWMLWESSSWFPSCYVLMVEGSVKPLLGKSIDHRVLEDQEKNFHRLAHTLDARLAQSLWLCGHHLTIADLVVAAPLYFHPYDKLPIKQHVHLTRWMDEQMSLLPCWNQLYERMSLEGINREDASLSLYDNGKEDVWDQSEQSTPPFGAF
ncbi:MAG TPA: glutathione S-transferase family protein [Oligoflexus sp.]|uniref:glutathione S-transferase family protein n=1 Tax=Oligoflexus sp. TaxID=1971216 RepID=UPI002D3D997C|nr:glutathione S-transferase family protein [Oligoflexus sp.]HYX38436.1 glutathione S-transferase family protein [Oligoflexus sp.]